MITDYYNKICKCLESCKTYEQWLSCRRMISNFHNKFEVFNTTTELRKYSNYILDKIKCDN